jgi:photosystem II stability/assembly factor-like uncharacterized protein
MASIRSSLSTFPILLFLFAWPAWAGWERIEIPSRDTGLLQDFSFLNDNVGFALVDGSFDHWIMKTVDGGLTWEDRYIDTENGLGDSSKIHFLSENEGFFFPNSSFGGEVLLHTTDGGMTFNPIATPYNDTNAGFFFDNLNFWVGGRGGARGCLAKTSDGGVTWATKETPLTIEVTDIWFLNQTHGWAIGDFDNVFRTTDGGETWEGTVGENIGAYRSVRFADPMTGWIVGDEGAILGSRDGGKTWSRIFFDPATLSASVPHFNYLEIIEGNWIMTANNNDEGSIWVSQNGGASWFQEGLPSGVVGLTAFARGGNTLFCGGGDDPTVTVGSGPMLLFRRKVNTMESPVIKVRPLPSGAMGAPYKVTLEAYEGAEPYTWSLANGDLPGPSLDPTTGVLSGAPEFSGTRFVTLMITDSNGKTDSWATGLRVYESRLALSSAALPSATHRLTYRASVDITGGVPPYSAIVTEGALPYGVTVDEKGRIAGVPQEVGTFNFTVRFSDSGSPSESVEEDFSLTVDPLAEARWDIQHAHNRLTDLHFFDENHGVAIGWSGVFVETLDSGKTWNLRPFTEAGQVVQLIDFDWIGDEGWMAAGGRVYHTTDRGKTWDFRGFPLLNTIGVRFFDSLHGCAYGNGISYTEDGGVTWNLATYPGFPFIFDLEFSTSTIGWAGGDLGVFLKSTDGGKTWEQHNLPEIGVAKAQEDVPETPGMVIAPGATARLAKGADDNRDKGALLPGQTASIFFLDEMRGWVGTNFHPATNATRIYRTTDGGQTWENQSVNRVVNLTNIQFSEDGLTGWASGLFSGRTWRTTNGGGFWSQVSFSDSGNEGNFGGMVFLDENTGWLLHNILGDSVMPTQSTQFQTYHESSVWKTTDGGRSYFKQYGWEEIDETEEATASLFGRAFGPDIKEVKFFDSVHGYALAKPSDIGIANFQLYQTDNGGATWRHIAEIPGTRTVAFLDEFHLWAMNGSTESFDGGLNWINRAPLFLSQAKAGASEEKAVFENGRIFFLDDRHGWALTNQGIGATEDGGQTWRGVSENEEEDLFFLDRERGWAWTNGRVRSSTDGGETWEEAILGADARDFWLVKTIFFSDPGLGWAAGDKGIAMKKAGEDSLWEEIVYDETWDFQEVVFDNFSTGLMAGAELEVVEDEGTYETPILLSSVITDFTPENRVDLPVDGHRLYTAAIPDTANQYVYGSFGLGLKYAAPTDSLAITTRRLPESRVGDSYAAQLESMGGTPALTWSLCKGPLPEGLSLDASGQLSGTPTEPGNFPLRICLEDSLGQRASKEFQLRIEPAVSPTIVTDTLPNASVGVPYGVVLEAEGTQPAYLWYLEEGNLPPGFNLLRLGLLGGDPATPGTYEFLVRVRDTQNPQGTDLKLYQLTVEGDPAPECPVPPFCLSLDWYKNPPSGGGDINGDNEVDAEDAIEIQEQRAR